MSISQINGKELSILLSINGVTVYSEIFGIGADVAPGDFDPTDFGAVVSWFKADAISALSDGDPVTTWTDSGGAGRHVSATGTARPIYKVNILNSTMPVVRFDGTNDALQSSAFGAPIAQPMTRVTMLKASTSAALRFFADGSTADRNLSYLNADNGVSAYAGTFLHSGVGLVDTNWHVVTTLFDGANSKIWLDGVLAATGAAGAQGYGRVTIGSDESLAAGVNFSGDIAEQIEWSGDIGDAGRSATLIELARKYGMYNTGYRTVTSSIGGQNYQLLIPVVRTPHTAIIYVHGVGETENAPLTDGLKDDLVYDILEDGHMVASTNAHGDLGWGNQASVDDYEALCAELVANYGVTKIVVFSQSMGGLAGLTLVADGNVPEVKGWIGIYPVCSLANMYAGGAGTFHTAIESSYGIPGTGNYATQTAGYDPALRSGSDFAGIRMRFYASSGDTVVSKSGNTDAMKTLVNSHATESDVIVCTGDHGDPTHFQSVDFRAFLDRCLS